MPEVKVLKIMKAATDGKGITVHIYDPGKTYNIEQGILDVYGRTPGGPYFEIITGSGKGKPENISKPGKAKIESSQPDPSVPESEWGNPFKERKSMGSGKSSKSSKSSKSGKFTRKNKK